jgi:Zn-dependent protease
MDGSFRIGSIFGIPIHIHYTFLLVIPLFAWIIGSQINYTIEDIASIGVPIDTSLLTAGFVPYIVGTIVALGLFFGVPIRSWREQRGSGSIASPL